MNREKRAFQASGLEVREQSGRPTIVGYAALFNSRSNDLGGFVEEIMPGAFSGAISSSDVRALWNHNDDMVLGRTKSGTLRLMEDEVGLRIEVDPPDTTWARDALVTINRGDVDQMSFAFTLAKGGDKLSRTEDGKTLRTIERVGELFDVSPVTYPAYQDTAVSLRALVEARGLSEEEKTALAEVLEPEPKESNPVPAGGQGEPEAQRSDDPVHAGRLTTLHRLLDLSSLS
jgi:uncharacterized protein